MSNFADYNLGIIGFGSFGSFLAGLLPEDSRKLVFDIESRQSSVANLEFVRLHELLQNADIIFLAVPIAVYPELLTQLRESRALIIDIASVKVEPTKLFQQHLSADHEVLQMHPLFGPESAASGLDGHKLIVTGKKGDRAQQVIDYFDSVGADIIETTAEAHDQQMAYTHVLTFFISRALLNMKIRDVELSAPSFQKLLALEELESHHSDDLFKTIQRGNPYGDAVRQELMTALKQLEDDIVNS